MATISETKEELEKRKLLAEIEKAQRDLATYDERLDIERRRVRNDRSRFLWETIRLLGVAIITSLIGFYSTSTLKKAEFAEENKQANIDRFYDGLKEISALKTELERCEKSCTLYESFQPKKIPEIETELQGVFAICQKKDEIVSLIKEREELDKQVKTIGASNDVKAEFDSVEKKVNNLNQLVEANTATNAQKQELRILEDSFSRLIDRTGMSEISSKTDQVSKDFDKTSEENKKIVNRISKKDEKKMVSGYPKNGWFKQGYFLVFDDIKISMDKLNANQETIVVDICGTGASGSCDNIILPNAILRKDGPISFIIKNHEYILRLDRIGSAGKNPFSKAAYIALEKYAKD